MPNQITGRLTTLASNVRFGTAYVSSSAFVCDTAAVLTLFVDNATNGTQAVGRIKFQFSPDNTSWYDASELSTVASGTIVLSTHQLTGDPQAYRFRVPVTDNYFRVQYQKLASAAGGLQTGGTLSISVVDGLS
mgnify:CR=1 FL=1